MKQSRICMLDLEMSGLDPDEERIIEVACFVVEADLTPVEGAEMCLAVMPDDPGVLDTMDDWNTRTHGESGLIRRIREEGVSIAEAEEAVMALLKEHMTKGAIIAGNSVHHDMRFIRREMPMVADYCTFRIRDFIGTDHFRLHFGDGTSVLHPRAFGHQQIRHHPHLHGFIFRFQHS